MARRFSLESMRRLVAFCVHERPGLASPSSEAEWQELVDAAAFHGVRPLLWARLDHEDIPTKQRTELASHMAYNRFVVQLLTEQEDRLREALEAASVPHRMLKGATIARRYYAAPEQREVNDIDVLIAPTALEATDRVLEDLGYTAWMLDQARFGRSKELMYRNRVPDPRPVWIDLHQRLFSAVPDDELTARLLADEPDPVAELVYVAGHAAAHRLARLKYFIDLHRIAASRGDWDWDAVRPLIAASPLGPGMDLAIRSLPELGSDAAAGYCDSPTLISKPAAHLLRALAGPDLLSHLACGATLHGPRGLTVGATMVRGLGTRLRQFRRALFPDAVELRQSHGRTATESVLRIRLRRLAQIAVPAPRNAHA